MEIGTIKKDEVFARIFSFIFILSILVNYYLRSSIFISMFAYINILTFCFIIFYFLLNIKNVNVNILFIILLSIIIFISNKISIYGYDGFISTFQSILFLISPLLFFAVKHQSQNFSKFLSIFLRSFNIFILVVFILMIFDFLSSYQFYKIYISFFPKFSPFYQKGIGSLNRVPSIIGHQLITKTFFLLYFLLNFLYKKKSGIYISNPILIIFVSIIGITLTGSKTGIVLLLVALGYLNLQNRNFFILLSSILFILVFYYVGVFDSIIDRFLNTTLTTGRLKAWDQVKYGLPPIKFFYGYGDLFFYNLKYFYTETVITASFEFPFVSLTYMYGLLFTILFYFELFILPIIYFFKSKNIVVLFSYLLLVVDFNTYNQIVFNPDFVAYIVMINYLFFALSNMNKKENNNFLMEI